MEAAIAKRKLEEQLDAIREQEEADQHRLEVERQLRISQMRKAVQGAEAQRNREKGEIELQVRKRVAEAKKQGVDDRKRR